MKLVEALGLLKNVKSRKGEAYRCFLATGANPLHLTTFLTAELALVLPDQRIELQQGLYGDFVGNLSRLADANADSAIVLMEWSDLDPRLGIRTASPWTPSSCGDILSNVNARVLDVQQSVEKASQRMPVVLSTPTLPIPPISFVPGWQASSFELELKIAVQSLASGVSQLAQVRVLNPQRVDLVSPLQDRLDIESELLTGFPYKLPHASALANLLANLVRKPVPKKGLITDLDDTLWRGIVGEVGIDGISWDLDHHSQMHAFYQRLLGALSTEGVLIAVASKNELSMVEKAFTRKDLAITVNSIFPMEVSWGPKSEATSRILKTWNIAADSVVFIDDSPLELAEVKASHPGMECIQFPTKDAAGIYSLSLRLRDLFGKSAILEEDAIRAESIRRSHTRISNEETAKTTPANFLEQAQAEISFNFSKLPLDPRALELVNKTNQFNLNGKRYTEASWQNYLQDSGSLLLVVSYTDKYGPLGKIAVVAGRRDAKKLKVDTWVMSCRAFSRRIEYKTLEELFTKFDVDEIELDFVPTERNSPLREFLTVIFGEAPSPGCVISRNVFESRSKLAQVPQEIANG